MAISNDELKQKLKDIAEQFAQRWSYKKAEELKDKIEDHLYSECDSEDKEFWQSHLTFLELNSDEKGEYAMLSVDISDNRKGGLFTKGSAYSPVTASLIIYKDGSHEIYL